MEQPSDRLYTISQVAEILHLPCTWIYERTRKSVIPHRKLGKYIRFTDSDLWAIKRMCSRGPREERDQSSNKEPTLA